MTEHGHDCHLHRSGSADQQEPHDGGEHDSGFAQDNTHLVLALRDFDLAEFLAGEEPEPAENQESTRHDDGELGGNLGGNESGDDGARDPNDLLSGGVERKQRGQLLGGHHGGVDGANGGLNRGCCKTSHEADSNVGTNGHRDKRYAGHTESRDDDRENDDGAHPPVTHPP